MLASCGEDLYDSCSMFNKFHYKEIIMFNSMKSFGALAAVIVSLGVLSACNTIAGAGEDMRAAGSKIERSAQNIKQY